MQLENNALLREVAFNIGTLREAKKRFSDRLAPEFSIFDYTRSDEMALSNCLAGLLDPKGKHGQGSIFLREFFRALLPDTNWIENYESCDVTTEKQANGQRRIDVHLSFEEGFVGIENKPWAGDQGNQLIDYAYYLKHSAVGKRWVLIYICNDQPSDDSISANTREILTKSGNYVSVNYFQLVEWLDGCHAKAKALSVQIFVAEIAKFIRLKINGELEMSEENETCKTVLSSKESLAAAFDIYKSLDGIKRNLLIKFRDDMKVELESHGFHLVWDKNLENRWVGCAGFGVKFREEQDLYLRFEFQYTGLSGLEWGICRVNDMIVNDPDRWSAVRCCMAEKFQAGKASAGWPWYSTSTKDGLGVDISDWNKSSLPWVLIMDSGGDRLAKRVAALACRVRTALAGDMPLLSAT